MDNLEVNNLNIATKEKLGETKIVNSVTLDETNSNIKKILTVCAKPFVENLSVNKSEIKIEGYIEYNLLVVFDDDSIMPLSQKSKFNKSFESSDINEKDNVTIDCSVLEVNVLDENGFTVESTIECKVYKINDNKSVACAVPSENIFVKTNKIEYSSFVNSVDYNAELSFEINKDNKFNKVLFMTSEIFIKSVIPAVDYFVVSGEVYSTIVYQNEEGQIKSVVKENEFSEEIESKGVDKESIIQAKAFVKENKIVENNEKNVFDFSVSFVINAEIFNRNSCENIVDAYSLSNEVTLKNVNLIEGNFYSTRQLENVVTTSTSLDNNLQNVDKILAVVPNYIANLNQIVSNGNVLFEGFSSINIIYYSLDEDGQEVLNSMDVEVPYSMKFDVEDIKEGDFICSNIAIKDISVKNKMGRELEILVEFKIDYNLISNNNLNVTNEIVIGNEKEKPDYSMEICFGLGGEQSLWDIAKRLNISLEDLTKQNGELSLPIKNGEKFVAYNQNFVDMD